MIIEDGQLSYSLYLVPISSLKIVIVTIISGTYIIIEDGQ